MSEDAKMKAAYENAVKHNPAWRRLASICEASKIVQNPGPTLLEAFEEAYAAGFQRGEGEAWRQAAREMADGAPPGIVT